MAKKTKKTDDREFINFCYTRILGRAPDKAGGAGYLLALKSGALTREDILVRFITGDEFSSKSGTQEFVPSGHYYSAIPSMADRDAYISSERPLQTELPGVEINTATQLALLDEFKQYHDDCPFPETKSKGFRFYFDNGAYSWTDALTLYSMIRHFGPERIIEIGSGHSSCVMLDTNDRYFDGKIDLTFIEPYPELLHSLLRKADHKRSIIPERVQDVDLHTFDELRENDILFVDSTHVSKLDSDVNRILFEILPSLKKGVVIHFHDIFWPFEYPRSWIADGRAWNEAYLLRTFLEFNESFEILFFADYLHQTKPDWFKSHMPRYLGNTGANLWLRKTKD